MYVKREPSKPDIESTLDCIDIDFAGFYTVRRDRLGRLCALIFAQAQSDGASSVKMHYGDNKMIYTIDEVDYEMVPCPAPSNVDLVRAIAKSSRLTGERPGELSVAFADLHVEFKIRHQGSADDPFLDVTGFTGERISLTAENEPAVPA